QRVDPREAGDEVIAEHADGERNRYHDARSENGQPKALTPSLARGKRLRMMFEQPCRGFGLRQFRNVARQADGAVQGWTAARWTSAGPWWLAISFTSLLTMA